MARIKTSQHSQLPAQPNGSAPESVEMADLSKRHNGNTKRRNGPTTGRILGPLEECDDNHRHD